MKNKMFFILLAFSITNCGGGSSSGSGAPAASVGTITGTIVLADSVSLALTNGYGLEAKASANVRVVVEDDETLYSDTDEEGKFTIANVPSGTKCIHASAQALDNQTYGFRICDITVGESEETTVGEAEMTMAGTLSGNVTLNGQTDHTGINVYIPGSSFVARTDANGDFSIVDLPASTYSNLRAEKDGYGYSELQDIVVGSNQNTAVDNMILFLSTGVDGSVTINNGSETSSSRTVTINLFYSNDATLMKISEDPDFLNVSWEAVDHSKPYTFASGGEKTIYVMYANANGLATSAFSATIYVNLFDYSDSWTTIANYGGGTIPTARTADASPGANPVVDGKLCVWGGQITGNFITNTGGCYDPADDSWATITVSGAPSSRYAHSEVSINGLLCIWGGTPGAASDAKNNGACYNPQTDTWTAISNTGGGTIPEARWHHSAAVVQGEMCVWGGIDTANHYIVTGGCYNPTSDSWSTIANSGGGAIPAERAEASAITIGDEMCLWGGYGTSWSQTGACYNPSSDSWRTISNTGGGSLPVARYSHGAAAISGKMCIWGGMDSSAQPLNNGGCYDPTTDSWTMISNTGGGEIPSARMYVENSLNLADQFCIWGGAGSNNSRLNDGACYSLSDDSWSAISNSGGGDIPSGRVRPYAGVIDGQMVIWGGIDTTGQLDTGGIWAPDF